MLPALSPGDEVLAWRWVRPGPRDIVVAKIGHRYLIKRVTKADDDKVYLSGDNPQDSVDSRTLGWIDRRNLIGRVFFVKRAGEGE